MTSRQESLHQIKSCVLYSRCLRPVTIPRKGRKVADKRRVDDSGGWALVTYGTARVQKHKELLTSKRKAFIRSRAASYAAVA